MTNEHLPTAGTREALAMIDALTHAPDVTIETPELPPEPNERPVPAYAHTVADVLPLLREVRDASRGGVPLPREWECVAAVFGGITRKELERTHETADALRKRRANLDPQNPFNAHREAGRYLPAGLHTITGQTGGGKTATVMNLVHAALKAGHPVLYVSLELDAPELAARLLALEAQLPWSPLALRRPLHNAAHAETRDSAITSLTPHARRFVALVPDSGVTFAALAADIRATALRLWRDTECTRAPLVLFDYLQAAGILTPEGGREAALREHIAAVAMELRRLSREQLPDAPEWPGCPVMALSLTARTNVSGKEKVAGFGDSPDLLRRADLETLKALPKEAGEVEGSAVTAWVMALGEDEHGTGERPLTLRLAKNRIGPDGQWIPFVFDGKTGALREAPERYAAAATQDAENAERKRLERLKAQKQQRKELEELRKEFGGAVDATGLLKSAPRVVE